MGGIVYRFENKASTVTHILESRTTIFSKLENKAILITHFLKNQEQPFSASLKTKQAQSLTF